MTLPAPGVPDRSADTRERRLLTALHPYAREGLHAVSLRRISTEAGSRNSGAMHYHFQNKLGVVQALVEMIARELGRIATALRPERALAEQLPELPAPVRRTRPMFMSTNVFHGVAEVAWLAHTPLGDLSHLDENTLLDHLVDYLIGDLQAPSLTAL
jgi:AcrR family transcriptional regulator